ncbi:hypothetical protein DFH07DRAFT_778139 [Mycena maculata]|uniref:Uncharacterized protein n=1 Tax=Mycena maculata TaxID=230809 RepID=A0AAD7IGK8_9AGAR|nr:hypothetical protein DFH07DRAFT_778139 [Mycena maculata]
MTLAKGWNAHTVSLKGTTRGDKRQQCRGPGVPPQEREVGARCGRALARGVERDVAASLVDVKAVGNEGNTALHGADVERNKAMTTREVGEVDMKRQGTMESGRSGGGGKEQTRQWWPSGDDTFLQAL